MQTYHSPVTFQRQIAVLVYMNRVRGRGVVADTNYQLRFDALIMDARGLVSFVPANYSIGAAIKYSAFDCV